MKKKNKKKVKTRVKPKTYVHHLSCAISKLFLTSQLPAQEMY